MKFITQLKKRFTWIDAALTSVLIILITIAGYLLFISTGYSKVAEQNKNAKEASTVTVDTIDSTYPGIKIVLQTSNSQKAPYTIQYPQSIHTPFNDEVKAFVNEAKKAYLDELSDQPLSKEIPKRELNISFETIQHASGTYSFVMVHQSYAGDKTGMFEIRSFHLDPDTGEQLAIENLFTTEEESLKHITERIQNAFLNDPAYQETFQSEAFNKYITTNDWDALNNFAITDESVIFYFPIGLFTKKTDGPPIVSVPLEQLSNQLTTSFKLPIDTSIEEQTAQANENVSDTQTPENNDSIPTDSTSTTEQVETTQKRVALTFDDGPNPKTTEQILDTLQKYDAKATFFMLGSRVEYYPDIAKQIHTNGHELGNHTWSHKDLTKLSAEQIVNEINRTSSIIEQVTGAKSTVFRPPYGAVNNHVRSQTTLPVILWDVDTLDWKYRDPAQIFKSVQQYTKDGSIILMHDIHQSTADGLDRILAYLQAEGYTFVTVSELTQ